MGLSRDKIQLVRLYLSVPYSEKDEAKSLGARWDINEKKWYVSNGDSARFRKWLPSVSQKLTRPELTMEMIPEPLHYMSVRDILPSSWERIRSATILNSKVDGKPQCEICGGSNQALHAHEQWSYDDHSSVQKLAGLMAICGDCHRCKHMGLAQIKGKLDMAYAHYQLHRGVSYETAVREHRRASAEAEKRGKFIWHQDFALLRELGVAVPAVSQRVDLMINFGQLMFWQSCRKSGQEIVARKQCDELMTRLGVESSQLDACWTDVLEYIQKESALAGHWSGGFVGQWYEVTFPWWLLSGLEFEYRYPQKAKISALRVEESISKLPTLHRVEARRLVMDEIASGGRRWSQNDVPETVS